MALITLQSAQLAFGDVALLDHTALSIETNNGFAVDGIADDAVLAVLGIDPSTITLKLGTKHATVATAQTALARVLKVKVKADGVFGSGTLRLVKRFQKTVGLKQTGVINHETWMALLSASSQQ